jgi:hypothetical protein
MDQNQRSFSLSDKDYAVINHVTTILKDTLSVQQEILSQIHLMNNRILSIEHRLDECIRDARNTKVKI